MKTTLQYALTAVVALILGIPSTTLHAERARPNVLFIAVDDLRPEINRFGAPWMVTPHLDRLADRGVRFDRAYSNNAICGASRASMLAGLHATPTRFVTYNTRVSEDAPGVPTLVAMFKQHGYHTVSNGKVYHNGDDDLAAWSQPPWKAEPKGDVVWWATEESRAIDAQEGTQGPAYESADVDEALYPDARIASRTIEDLRRLSEADEPFFIACGFVKPHLPFVAPTKYWDLYPLEETHLPDNMYFPRGMPEAFSYRWGEMRRYHGIPKEGPVSDDLAKTLIRGYRASVSLIDTQVGRLLDAVDELGLADNTIIVLWSDHGFQLGEHGFWCKHTDFEVATLIPLIVVAPGIEGQRSTTRLVESVDLYPTLCELAGIAAPDHIVGRSFVPLLHDTQAEHKDAIFTRHWRSDAVRTDRFRYMETRADGGLGELEGVALFDVQNDPDENHNVAQDPAYANVVDDLRARLTQHRNW
ncbi:MAG: sulfatase [Planctomycetota bacterium]